MGAAFDFERFVLAQEPVIAQVRAELKAGCKNTHWMWFVFPQLAGLGFSHRARFYAITSLDGARAYIARPPLGPRLVECTELVNAVEGRSAHDIFGSPDDLKFHSSMTLFALAAPDEVAFPTALERYCGGRHDGRTLDLLGIRR